MGVYCRKRPGRKIWWVCFTANGRQVFESSHSTSKRFAEKLLAIRQAEVAAGRFEILKPSPTLAEWSAKYVETVQHPNTRSRYASSRKNLISFFSSSARLNHISTARIAEFIKHRQAEGVKAATTNRDLRLLSQVLKEAERQRYLARSPFELAKFFRNELNDRRIPHILTESEEKRLLAV